MIVCVEFGGPCSGGQIFDSSAFYPIQQAHRMSDSQTRDQDPPSEHPSVDHVFASIEELFSAIRKVDRSTALSLSERVVLKVAYAKQFERFRPPSDCESTP